MKRLALILLIAGLYACGGGGDSSGGAGTAGADAGCYFVPSANVSFEWPGGPGPQIIGIFESASCDATAAVGDELVVVAENEADAAARCGTGGAEEVTTAPPAEAPNSFFGCVSV